MKILTVIVHTNVQQELSDLLRTMDQVPGFTFTHVEGHGNEVEGDSFVSARDEVVGYISRIPSQPSRSNPVFQAEIK